MKTLMFWACTGIDASELSYHTALLLSEEEKTLIAEFPCLGIPRLGFVCGVMDRGRSTEAAIINFEQKRSVNWELFHTLSKRLTVLPASVFAAPDYPVTSKVNVSTLMDFVPALQSSARDHGFSRLVLECQGQLNSPMTFFSLKAANRVVIPLGKPTEAAYALASIRRLVQVYKHPPEKFILAAAGNYRAIEGAVFRKDKENEILSGVRVVAWDNRKIKGLLEKDAYGEADLYEAGGEREQVAENSPVYL